MTKPKVRSLPQEEESTKFTRADLRILGNLSVNLGMLHWQNGDVGTWENQVALLVMQQEKLNDLIAEILMREI